MNGDKWRKAAGLAEPLWVSFFAPRCFRGDLPLPTHLRRHANYLMQRGKKPATAARKKLAGTYAKSRDDVKTMLGPTADETGPIMPEWLTPAAREVWAVDIARVVGCGATAADSHMFALYCTTMADFISSVQSGAPHNAAFRSELRKQAEMLGIAGAKSRISKLTQDGAAKASPFSVRPR